MPESKHTTGRSKNQDLIDLLLTMEVGDSFTLPANRRNSLESVQAMMKKQGRTQGRHWSVRKEDNVTTRVWRTE